MEAPLMPSRRLSDKSFCSRLKRFVTGAGAALFGKCFPCFSPDSAFTDDTLPELEKPVVVLPPPDLRLLCSYGGQLSGDDMCGPRYRGGENRIISVDRHCSAAELFHRLSTSLLGGRGFTLKYQLSVQQGYNSLMITVVNDEDLKFLIEEYDRISSVFMPHMPGGKLRPAKPPCPVPQRRYIRVFLFPKEAEDNGVLLSVTAYDTESSSEDDDDDDDYIEDDDDDETLDKSKSTVVGNNGSLQRPLNLLPPLLPQMKKKLGDSAGGSSSTSRAH